MQIFTSVSVKCSSKSQTTQNITPTPQNILDELLTRAPEYGDEVTGELAPIPLNAMLNWPKVCALPQASWVFKSLSIKICMQPDQRMLELRLLGNFFTWRFHPGFHSVDNPWHVIVITDPGWPLAYKISHNVLTLSPFWLKGEPYSLSHMLNNDPLIPQSVGEAVYQAQLSTLSYHHRHSPACRWNDHQNHPRPLAHASLPHHLLGLRVEIPATPSRTFAVNPATRVVILV